MDSAGTDAGRPAMPDVVPPEVIEVMEPRGIDLRAHRARALTEDVLRGAELVIGMSRRHVKEAVARDPSCFSRAFTLTELVQRASALGPRRGGDLALGPRRGADLALGPWIEAVHGDRTRQALVAGSAAGDIADPYGGPRSGYRHVVLELDGLTGRLAALLWPGPGT